MVAVVKVLLQGVYSRTKQGFVSKSSVTLIRDDNKVILVDTGAPGQADELVNALKREGLSPEDVDCVILTHFHLDHTANVNLFRNARIISHTSVFEHGEFVKFNGDEVSADVRVINVPGHSLDDLAVIIKTDDGVVAAVGDLLPTRANLTRTPLIFYSESKWRANLKRILKMADVIIPGHDKLFRNERGKT